MKNKSTTYLLIGVVVLIWGLVIYRIFSAVNEEEQGFSPYANPHLVSKTKGKESSDTFELIADYRDPFLGKVAASSDHTAQKRGLRSKKPAAVTAPLVPIDWSFISFLGTIKNKQVHKEIGLFRLHGQEVMMSALETRGDVSVLKISKDSAWVKYQGVKKGLSKSY